VLASRHSRGIRSGGRELHDPAAAEWGVRRGAPRSYFTGCEAPSQSERRRAGIPDPIAWRIRLETPPRV